MESETISIITSIAACIGIVGTFLYARKAFDKSNHEMCQKHNEEINTLKNSTAEHARSFDKIDSRFDKHDVKFDRINQKLDILIGFRE